MEALVAVVNSQDELDTLIDQNFVFTPLFNCDHSPLLSIVDEVNGSLPKVDDSLSKVEDSLPRVEDSQKEMLIQQALTNIQKIDISDCEHATESNDVFLYIHQYAIEKLTDSIFLNTLFQKFNSDQILVSIPNKGYLAVSHIDNEHTLFSMTNNAHQHVEAPISHHIFKLTKDSSVVECITNASLEAKFAQLPKMVEHNIYAETEAELFEHCHDLIHQQLNRIFEKNQTRAKLTLHFSDENSRDRVTSVAKLCKQYFDSDHIIRAHFRNTLTSVCVQFSFGDESLNFELGYNDFKQFDETDCSFKIKGLKDVTFNDLKSIAKLPLLFMRQHQNIVCDHAFPQGVFEIGIENKSFKMVEAHYQNQELTLDIKQLSSPKDYKWVIALCARLLHELNVTVELNDESTSYHNAKQFMTDCSMAWIKNQCKTQLESFAKFQLAHPNTLSIIPTENLDFTYAISYLTVDALLKNTSSFATNFWMYYFIINHPHHYKFKHAKVESLNINENQSIEALHYQAGFGLIVNANNHNLIVLTDQLNCKVVTRLALEKQLASRIMLLSDTYTGYPIFDDAEFSELFQAITPVSDDLIASSPEFITHTEHDTTLTDAIFSVMLLVSQIDHQLTKQDCVRFANMLQNAAIKEQDDVLWKTTCALAFERIDSIESVLKDEETSTTDIILKALFALNQLDDAQAKSFKFKLMGLAYKVAQKETNNALYKSICDEEKVALDSIGYLLGIESNEIEQTV